VRDVHQARICAGLFRTEFDLMKSLFEKLGVDTLVLHIIQSLENYFFAFGEIFQGDALNAQSESSLAS